MHSFKSTIHHNRSRFVLKQVTELLFSIAFIFVLYRMDYLTTQLLLVSIVIGLLFIITLVEESNRTIINEVVIDTEHRQVSFHCFRFWEGSSKRQISFNELKIEIYIQKPVWLFQSLQIYFFKDKAREFYVSKRKDKFSKKTLEGLALLLGQLTKPATKGV
jgi:hypothetical protein